MNESELKKIYHAYTRSRIKRLDEIAIEYGWFGWSAYETAVLNKKCAPTKRPADLRQRARPKNKKRSGASR